MPKLEIGATQIDYHLLYSQTAKRKVIRFRNGACEVVVPVDSPDSSIFQFLRSNRRWIFEKYIKSKGIQHSSIDPWPEEFQNGGKVFWRGRYHKLNVVQTNSGEIRISYRNGIRVELPTAPDAALSYLMIKQAVNSWMRKRLLISSAQLTSKHSRSLSVPPPQIEVRALKNLWANCSPKGKILLGFELTFVAPRILEYVIVHELCHFVYRSHSGRFWQLLKRMLPDYESRKKELDKMRFKCVF